jgi:hypothetical protein
LVAGLLFRQVIVLLLRLLEVCDQNAARTGVISLTFLERRLFRRKTSRAALVGRDATFLTRMLKLLNSNSLTGTNNRFGLALE